VAKEKIEALKKAEIVGRGGNSISTGFNLLHDKYNTLIYLFVYCKNTNFNFKEYQSLQNIRNPMKSKFSNFQIFKFQIFFLLLFSASTFAQDPKQKESLQKIIETEKAFAQASIDKGTKNAFLEFLNKESIVFDKSTPVNGVEYWQNIDFKGVTTWQPVLAEISGSSDLAYTIGNFQFHNNTVEEKPSSFGSFVTLWKKQPDNTWKVAVDMGVTHDEVINTSTNITENFPTFKPYELKNQAVLSERMVFMNDHFYWKNAKSSLNPFEPHLSQNIRVHRKNLKPIIGKENAKVFLKKTYDKNVVYTGLKAIASNAGDLVGVYGVISGAGKSGNYLRIWKQEAKDSWKIVVEMVDM
jgi:ketosteroid isomerase-like protein